MTVKCFRCDGSGYVPNGDIQDGMMTGFDSCPVCHSAGTIPVERLDAELTRLMQLRTTSSKEPRRSVR